MFDIALNAEFFSLAIGSLATVFTFLTCVWMFTRKRVFPMLSMAVAMVIFMYQFAHFTMHLAPSNEPFTAFTAAHHIFDSVFIMLMSFMAGLSTKAKKIEFE